MRIFLDANTLVSVLNKEYPLFSYSSRIVSLADNKRSTVYTSPICLAIAFYFAGKKSGTRLAKQKIEILAQKIKVSTIGAKEVIQALQNKKVNGFEDGIEYYTAISSKCNIVVTEDINDFYFADTEVLTARSFSEKYLN